MNDCSSYKTLILKSLRDELSDADLSRLQEHLSACSACRREEREFRTVFALTGLEIGAEGPGIERLLPGLVGRIRSEGVGDSFPSTRRFGIGGRAILAASVLLLALGSIFLFRQTAGKGAMDDDRVVLLEPEFDLPEITLKEVSLASLNRADDEMRWEEDFDSARKLAAYASVPILYQVYDKGCPIARRLDRECFTSKEITSVCNDFICVRKTHDEDVLGVQPVASPAFFIIRPDGEVAQQFGGDISRERLLSLLAENVRRSGWIGFSEFKRYRALLEESAKAIRDKAFCRAQESMECFSGNCCNCCVKGAGIYEDFMFIQTAMQAYIEAKHAFARKLVENGEIDRALGFYERLLKEFEGLPVASTLRQEMEALSTGR